MSVRVVAITLRPAADQEASLRRTRAAWVQACTILSGVAWDRRVFRQYDLHRITYRRVREETGLLAQLAIRAIAVVAASYKTDQSARHEFSDKGAVVLDTPRLYRLRSTLAEISTLDGRLRIHTAIGGYQREQLARAAKLGEADLVLDRKGRWRLLVSCHFEDPPFVGSEHYLGVDMGIANLAADSDGERHSGAHVSGLRRRHRRLRARLSRKRTRSARRRLRQISGRQQRFQRDTNHRISKALVARASSSRRGIAVEQLEGIRERITAHGADNRSALGNWGFGQLGDFVRYKARMAGVALVAVDPRGTSRTCAECGCCDKRNRPSQAVFRCRACGHQAHADTNAARVIASRAAVNRPDVACGVALRAHGYKPPPSGGR